MPFVYREETYCLPHRIHHTRSDKIGDPYGPHLGWWGSLLAIDSVQRLNTDISERNFQQILKSLRHISFFPSSYATFRRFASFEHPLHFCLRSAFAQLFWVAVAYGLAGASSVFAMYGAMFLTLFFIKEFNYQGHEPLSSGRIGPRNNWFYGWFASEWHRHHHRYPNAAATAVHWWEPDAAFLFIRLLHRIGVIEQYRTPSSRKTGSEISPV